MRPRGPSRPSSSPSRRPRPEPAVAALLLSVACASAPLPPGVSVYASFGGGYRSRIDPRGYCFVDVQRPCIVLSEWYYRQGGDPDLYMDLLHELTHLRQLEEDEEHRVESLPLHPWVQTLKYDVVELVPEKVTGRYFRIHLDWSGGEGDD